MTDYLTIPARALKVGDRVHGIPAGGSGGLEGTVKKVDKTRTWGAVYVWTSDPAGTSADAILNQGDRIQVEVDTSSSVSCQHFIDTGDYLTYGEVADEDED